MSLNYELLDLRVTELGELMLRRRRMVRFPGLDIYEIKLGTEFLMTSLFHEAEDQLAKLGLAANSNAKLDVIVGGLGLGYTALAALNDTRITSLQVIEYLDAVIEWHQSGLLPQGKILTSDPRCKFILADFFAFAASEATKKYDVILLDIDHTPTNVLNSSNSAFYRTSGLKKLAGHLRPGGVFGLWADGSPDNSFTDTLHDVFDQAMAHEIRFENLVSGGISTGAVYIATL